MGVIGVLIHLQIIVRFVLYLKLPAVGQVAFVCPQAPRVSGAVQMPTPVPVVAFFVQRFSSLCNVCLIGGIPGGIFLVCWYAGRLIWASIVVEHIESWRRAAVRQVDSP